MSITIVPSPLAAGSRCTSPPQALSLLLGALSAEIPVPSRHLAQEVVHVAPQAWPLLLYVLLAELPVPPLHLAQGVELQA